MVESSANGPMVQPKNRTAMTSAARWIVLEHGQSSLIAPRPVETESRRRAFTSPDLPSMVVRTALGVTIAPTLRHATSVHALSIVLASGQSGRIAARSVVEARRPPGM